MSYIYCVVTYNFTQKNALMYPTLLPVRNYKTRVGLVRSYNSGHSKARCISIRKWHYKICTEEDFVRYHGLHKKEVDPKTGMFLYSALKKGPILRNCFCEVCKKIFGRGRINIAYK